MAARTRRHFTPFKKGEKVWLEARNLKRKVANPKFAPKREGPFTISDVLSPITYRLRLPRTWNIHLVFHASLLSPYRENSVHGPNFPKPPPDLIAGEEEYEIDRILRHRGTPRNRSFLIRWKGYTAEEDSWIPEANLSHATEILKEYKDLHPQAFPPRIALVSTFHPGQPDPEKIRPPSSSSYPSSHCHRQATRISCQLSAPEVLGSRNPRSLVLQNSQLPLPRLLNNMPCSYSDEPDFYVKEGEDTLIAGPAAEELTRAVRISLSLQDRMCHSPITPSSPSSLQPSTIDPETNVPSSPTSTLAEPGWGERSPRTTFTNVAPNTPAPYPVVSVDVPIHGHRLVDHFLDQNDMTRMQEALRNPRLAIPIGAHLDLASPLYALYKAYLQVSRLNQVAHDLQTTGTPPSLVANVRDIRHTALGDICVALHQLGMQHFLVDLERFVKENHAALRAPPPVFGNSSTTPSASSTALTPNEITVLNRTERDFVVSQGTSPLPPSHPKYSDACFQCHHLGHIRTECPVYQCPLCLHWSPGHAQKRCPLRRPTKPKSSSSSSAATSSHPSSPEKPRPVPGPTTRGRPRHQTARITPYSNPARGRRHLTPYPRQSGSGNSAIPDPSDEEYFVEAENNITGSPRGEWGY